MSGANGRQRGRILYLSNCNNYHTYKWSAFFAEAGYDVHVASLEAPKGGGVDELDGVTVHFLSNGGRRFGADLQKLGYFGTVRQLKALIANIDPDIVHAHYASSYGTICALACDRPYYLSVWGSDVYEFPQKSFVHRMLIRRSLAKATWVMSTSEAMAEETRKYTDKEIAITPFGVNMRLFNPAKAVPHEGIVVGTVKALESKYGIDTLLRACHEVHERRPDLGLRVRIAGKGTKEEELRALAKELGMESYVEWLGFIPQERAACEWASLDVALVPSESESESFGVSAVEAQASGTALIISDIPGLMEACDGGKTAVVVPRCDCKALADAIEELADDPDRRSAMGTTGRAYVAEAYEYEDCFKRVERIYESHSSVKGFTR